MNDQHTEGTIDQVTGKVKEAAGNLTGDGKTIAEGQNQQTEGSIRNAAGNVQDKAKNLGDRLGDAKDRIGDAITGNDSNSR